MIEKKRVNVIPSQFCIIFNCLRLPKCYLSSDHHPNSVHAVNLLWRVVLLDDGRSTWFRPSMMVGLRDWAMRMLLFNLPVLCLARHPLLIPTTTTTPALQLSSTLSRHNRERAREMNSYPQPMRCRTLIWKGHHVDSRDTTIFCRTFIGT
ncbi:hypothetical protein BDN72DRAFT_419851 [Pluteus cervinus]|uniref:Uncharacterized protein n=1 Tax=Pluteus cervinus TaxID=181527 RepID=A0ACD3A990_9AGAR|nr:hypothetical protein BDN72DRAFT_419851 [Pluteus cervinus]